VSAIKDGQSHQEHVGEEDDDDDGMVVLPPDMDVTPHSLSVNVFMAKDLPKVDRWGSCDGYIKLDFCGGSQRTDTITGFAPEWCTELKLAVNVPTMSDSIDVCLYDEDFGGDEVIGSAVYSFREVLESGVIGPHWTHIYGWPIDADEDIINECKNKGERPFSYKGSLLLSLEAAPDESAKQGRRPASMAQPPEECKYTLRCDVFQVSELPALSSTHLLILDCDLDLDLDLPGIRATHQRRKLQDLGRSGAREPPRTHLQAYPCHQTRRLQ